MAEDKGRQFVDRICEKTIAGSLSWEKTTKEGLLQTTLGGYVIRFSYDDDGQLYTLSLFNVEGQRMEVFNDEQFDRPGTAPEPTSMFQKMKLAYTAARRKALGVDKAITDILTELQ